MQDILALYILPFMSKQPPLYTLEGGKGKERIVKNRELINKKRIKRVNMMEISSYSGSSRRMKHLSHCDRL